MARTAHAAHNFIQDQQDPIAITDLSDSGEITFNRWHGSGCRPDYRLREKRDYGISPQPQDLVFEFLRHSLPVIKCRFFGTSIGVLKTR